jgi:hypothetical protein
MLQERQFNIVLVSKDHGIGMTEPEEYDRQVDYKGKKIRIKF